MAQKNRPVTASNVVTNDGTQFYCYISEIKGFVLVHSSEDHSFKLRRNSNTASNVFVYDGIQRISRIVWESQPLLKLFLVSPHLVCCDDFLYRWSSVVNLGKLPMNQIYIATTTNIARNSDWPKWTAPDATICRSKQLAEHGERVNHGNPLTSYLLLLFVIPDWNL